jgi:hypothetical protein
MNTLINERIPVAMPWHATWDDNKYILFGSQMLSECDQRLLILLLLERYITTTKVAKSHVRERIIKEVLLPAGSFWSIEECIENAVF